MDTDKAAQAAIRKIFHSKTLKRHCEIVLQCFFLDPIKLFTFPPEEKTVYRSVYRFDQCKQR